MGTIEYRKPKMLKNAKMKLLKKKATFGFLQTPT
jgi:hypothetical protein